MYFKILNTKYKLVLLLYSEFFVSYFSFISLTLKIKDCRLN